MKVVAYCTLWSIALALLVAMCAIIKQGHIEAISAKDSEVATGNAPNRTAAGSPAAKPVSRPTAPSV